MKKLMKGNEAIAEAAVRAGCRFFFGYPITPQNEIPEYMSKRLPEVGGCFLQAESEVSAINMVYGAGGAGARVMTSSSSPGISLKQEGISYLVGAEVPCVIVNMMRCGPGLGGIQPAQSDYYQATRGGGHGDYRTCVLAPASVQEAVDLTQAAFDIADRYRNPVMVLGDGLIGQMMEPVEMDNGYQPAADLALKSWAANGHAATPEQPRNIINSLYIEPAVLERHCLRLEGKYRQITEKETRWQEEMLEDAEVVVIAYGTTSRVARSAIRKCREMGIKAGMLRPITLWPFPTEAIRKTIPTAKHYLVVEMSAGQMVDDVRLAVNGERPVHFFGRMGGIVPSVGEVAAEIGKYAQPHQRSPLEAALDSVIDEKLTAVTGAVQEILKKAKKTISETHLFDAHTSLNFKPEQNGKPSDSGSGERAFDEIEAKFKAALEQMKVKLKEASGTIQAATSGEMERKVREAADLMAQRIRETAMRVEHKIEEAGLKPEPPAADAPEKEPEPAEAAAEPQPEPAPETAAEEDAEAMEEAMTEPEQAPEAAQEAVEQEAEPAAALEAAAAEVISDAEPDTEAPDEDELDEDDEEDDLDEDEDDDEDDLDEDEDDDDDLDEDEDDDEDDLDEDEDDEDDLDEDEDDDDEDDEDEDDEEDDEDDLDESKEEDDTQHGPDTDSDLAGSDVPVEAKAEDEDDDEDDGEFFVETAAQAIGAAAFQTPGAAALENTEEEAAQAEAPPQSTPERKTVPEAPKAKPVEAASQAPDNLEEKLRSAAAKLDDTFGKAADKLEDTLGQAADKLDDLTANDIDEKLKSAAQAVEDKLEEAGRKIEEFFSDPAVQGKSRYAGGSFFSRIGSLVKSFGRTGNAKSEPGDPKEKPAAPQDKEDEES